MRCWSICLAVALSASIAYADDDETSTPAPTPNEQPDPSAMAVNPIAIVKGNGVKIGESTTIYPVVGVEAGYVSNVFYQNTNPIGAPLLRLLGAVGIGSLSATRLDINKPDVNPTSPEPDRAFLQGRAELYAAWDRYLSGNSDVSAQGGVSGGAVLHALMNEGHPLTLDVLDNFERAIRPTNFESNVDTNQDLNHLTIHLTYHPTGRSLSFYLYYTHLLDLFEENQQQFADRLDNTFGGRVIYQFLPLTRFYVDVSGGLFEGVGSSSTKVDSYPFTAKAGVQTDLTLKLTLNGRIGYQRGFYASGPDYSTVIGGLQLGYRYSALGRVLLMYDYDYEDSINANFYRDHVFQLMIEQQLPPVMLFAKPEVHLRRYEGLLPQIMASTPVRDDVIFDLIAGVRYNFRDWLAASLEYHLTSDQTDFTYSVGGIVQDPSYVRHEIMLGLRAAL